MVQLSKQIIKENGIIFSEKDIATIMVDAAHTQITNLISRKNTIRILEPSVGDGSLVYYLLKSIPSNINIIIDCLDIHNHFLEKMKNSFSKNNNITINYIHQDYLNFTPSQKYDLIISNPPYVRTSSIGSRKSQELKKQFNLSGKIDLYHAFFVKMISELSNLGTLIIVTSNKYLYNKTGYSLRKNIIDNLNIDLLIDLGDTKLFDAAVLPSILIGSKNQNQQSKFISIYENHSSILPSASIKNFDSINEAIKKSHNTNFQYKNLIYKIKKGDLVIEDYNIFLLSNSEHNFKKQMEQKSKFLLKDIATVKVGIKTTADKVFLFKKHPINIEKELIYPIIVSKSIQKWNVVSEKNKFIVYPYKANSEKKEVIKLTDYPNCKKYFESHGDILKSRKYIMESNREWFEIWVPHYPRIWKKEKIVFRDISSHGIFAYDKGSIVNGDSYFIILNDNVDNDYIYLLLGLLNSKIIAKYHNLVFPNKLYSNKKRFNSQYVEKYPIPDINLTLSQNIVEKVKKLLTAPTSDINILEEEINILCEKIYS